MKEKYLDPVLEVLSSGCKDLMDYFVTGDGVEESQSDGNVEIKERCTVYGNFGDTGELLEED